MKHLLRVVLFLNASAVVAGPGTGLASWYGEEHRGKLTAASWFYRLGTKVRVTAAGTTNAVEVTITDRGPAKAFVRQGRIIDLSRAAFERLAPAGLGLIDVRVEDSFVDDDNPATSPMVQPKLPVVEFQNLGRWVRRAAPVPPLDTSMFECH